MQKQIILILFLFSVNYYSFAQCTDMLYIKQLESKIKTFKKERNVDSLVYYTYACAACWQEVDSLANWLNLHSELAYAIRRNNYQLAIHCLDTVSINPAYREPLTLVEKKAALRVNLMKGYLARNYVEAIQIYEKALQKYKAYELRPEDYPVHETLYKPLGANYTRRGDNEKAQNILKEAIKIGRELKDRESLAGNYLNLGKTYWNQGNNESALQCYEEGLAVDSVSSYRRSMLFLQRAVSYHEINNNEAALKAAGEASENCRISTDRRTPIVVAGVNEILASIALDKQAYDKAHNYIDKAIKIKQDYYGKQSRELGKAYIQLGEIYTAEKHYEQAIQQHNLALSTILPAFQATELNDLPNKDLFYKENTIFEALSGKADALYGLYEVSKDEKHLETALKCHELALEAELNLRRDYQYESSKLYLQSQTRKRTAKAIEIAYLLYQKTKDEQYVNRAFRLSESSRAVLLLEGIAQNFVRQKLAGDSLFIRENELQRLRIYHWEQIQTSKDSATITRHKEDKLAIENQLETIQKQIEKRYPQYKNELNNRLADISVANVQNSLADGTDLVEYFQTNDAFYAFKINNEKADFIKIKMTQKDLNTIQQFLNLFEKNSNDSIRAYTQPYATLAHNVYRRIYSPLRISSDNEVIIVPEGVLSTLPFDALLTEQSDAKDFGSLPYLLRSNRIRYAYSTAVYLQKFTENNTAKNSSLLAFAPIFKGQSDELLKSDEEVSQITNLIRGKIFKNEEATQEKFITHAPHYDILHLSTHANAGGDGLHPQIRFSDKAMLLPELYTLRLYAKLAVLSACQTALGKNEQGEGVMSLARGFTYAGVPRLVTSLWNVNDAATADLMTDFYQQLKTDLPTDQALHQAQLNYLDAAPQTRRSPYYWAGWVHIGQPARVSVRSPMPKQMWLIGGVFIGLLLGLLWWRRKK